jgi:hypothetical protein
MLQKVRRGAKRRRFAPRRYYEKDARTARLRHPSARFSGDALIRRANVNADTFAASPSDSSTNP